MSKIRNYIMAGALAFATIVPVTVAEAGPMAPAPIKVEKTSDVTQVRCGRWGCRGRYWGGRRAYWGPRYGVRRYWGPRRVWVAPVIVAPRIVVRRGYNAHVRWCMNRYGSYNPRTNTFLAYDGYYKRCVSPY
jgi:hypothetical protein